MLDVYKASAGSGKTYTLAKRYIRMLLGYTDSNGRRHLYRHAPMAHRSLLAITFTNKATEEMKNRIVHELSLLALNPATMAVLEPTERSPYLEEFMADFDASEEEIAAAASEALKQLLYDYGMFSVSTIDSFFQTILRAFAREAELDGNYEVDLDESTAIFNGVNDLLNSLDHNTDAETRQLMGWVTEYALTRFNEGKAFNVFDRGSNTFSEFLSFFKTLFNETFEENIDKMLRWLSDPSRIKRFRDGLTSRADNLVEVARSASQKALRTASGHEQLISANAFKLLNSWAAAIPSKLPGLKLNQTEQNPAKAFKGKTEPPAILVADVSEAFSAIVEAKKMWELLNKMSVNVYAMGLIGNVTDSIHKILEQNNSLLLKDTNSVLHRIIADNDSPFIFERLNQYYRHFLIDEFQDTSRLQWENLSKLIAESVSFGNESLVIGDEKQCIYRFRNSDPTLLTNIAGDFPGNTAITGNDVAGNTNWRSAADIVRFNNVLFKSMAEAAGLGDIYANVVQSVAPKRRELQGYVRISDLRFTLGTKATSEEFITRSFETTIGEIRRQLRAGYRGGEIAVLFRTNDTARSFIETLLPVLSSDPDFKGVKISSDEALALKNSPAVRVVMSILKTMTASDFVTSDRNVSMREIAILNKDYEEECAAGHPVSEAFARAVGNYMRRRRERAENPETAIDPAPVNLGKGNSLPSVVRNIIASLSEEQRVNQNAYLTSLLDLAIDHSEKTGEGDIASFVSWWENYGNRTAMVDTDADPDAICVMTIHKSKGLEFPCVHIPYIDKKNRERLRWFRTPQIEGINDDDRPELVPLIPSKAMLGTPFDEQYRKYDREVLSDMINVLYVAFTRAGRELCVNIGAKGGNGTSLVENALELGGFVADAATGNIIAGAPTSPVREKSKRSVLEPVESFFIDPIGAATENRDIWAGVTLDDDESPSESYTERFIALLRNRRSASAIGKEIRRLAAQHFIDIATADRLSADISSALADTTVARWYDSVSSVTCHAAVNFENGGSWLIDRLVVLPGGDIHAVEIVDDPDRYPDIPSKRQRLHRLTAAVRSALDAAEAKRVTAWLWTPGHPPVRL